MKKNGKVQHDWKAFAAVLKESRIPWIWFIVNLVIGMVVSTVYAKLPMVQGQIMAGEIQDTGTIVTYALFTIASALIMIPTSLLGAYATAATTRNFNQNIWSKIVYMPMRHLDTVPPTSLVSRVTTDGGNISYTISYIFSLIQTIYSIGVTMAMIAGMNRNMALLMLLLIPFILLANIPSHFMHDVQHQAQTALAGYTNFLAERLGALKQIKASGAEEKEDAINDAAAMAYFKARVKMALLDMLSQPLTYSMEAVIQAIVLIYGGYLLSTGAMDAASMVALYSYASMLTYQPMQFVFFWQQVKITQGATHTISEFLQCPPEKMERSKSFAIPDAALKLEDVSFVYEGGEEVLHHVSMDIPTGKVTAIVGPSGSGKTTVLKLLERLYQPTGGKLMFGGVPAEDIHLGEWRESFGMVPQSSPLLFGTVRDNITYGIDEGVGEAKLRQAMDAANVTEIVSRLPGGLETDVGDVGSKLSGGEKQRIAIARMMIRDPSYLLLDEATSSLDAENEYQITQALGKLMKGRTTIIVAHNLRTIEHADNIIFMENGRVVANGTHSQLYQENPTYRRYVDLQKI
ncbi:MAG: ABC transporter ATP-binding protein/permease [Oscillospiraceae bacterium]|nr:ABC transporter ATP-binding protein/permease [Oscillospiraceae bacterium]